MLDGIMVHVLKFGCGSAYNAYRVQYSSVLYRKKEEQQSCQMPLLPPPPPPHSVVV